MLLFWLCCFVFNDQGQSQRIPTHSSGSVRISGFRVERAGPEAGALFVSLDGSESRVADKALNAWVIDNGRQIVYSGEDGAGGYENEGQSLRLYDPVTGQTRKILSEYFAIERVEELKTDNGKRALLVEMLDGGLGASHLAVVDPARGEVLAVRKARLLSRRDDLIVLGYYRDEDWEAMAKGKTVAPFKTGSYHVGRLLKRRVMVNKQAP